MRYIYSESVSRRSSQLTNDMCLQCKCAYLDEACFASKIRHIDDHVIDIRTTESVARTADDWLLCSYAPTILRTSQIYTLLCAQCTKTLIPCHPPTKNVSILPLSQTNADCLPPSHTKSFPFCFHPAQLCSYETDKAKSKSNDDVRCAGYKLWCRFSICLNCWIEMAQCHLQIRTIRTAELWDTSLIFIWKPIQQECSPWFVM